MKFREILMILCGVITASGVHAQQSSGGVITQLNYSDAYTIAHNNSLALKAHEHEVRSLEYGVKSAQGLFLPHVNVIGNFTLMSEDIDMNLNDLKEPISGALSGASIPEQLQPVIQEFTKAITSFSWGALPLQKQSFGFLAVEAGIPIYTGGKIRAAVNASKILLQRGESQLDREMGIINSELAARYFGLSLAQSVLDVRRQVVSAMELHYRNAESLERNGQIAGGEKLFVEMFLDRARADEAKSQSDVATVNRALCGTLNNEGEYTPTSPMFILTELPPVEYFIDHAVINSPILKDVGYTKSLAEEKRRADNADLLPHLTAVGGVNVVDYQLSDMLPQAMVGVNLTYRLFNAATGVNKSRAAKQTLARIEVLEKKAVEDIKTLVIKKSTETNN